MIFTEQQEHTIKRVHAYASGELKKHNIPAIILILPDTTNFNVVEVIRVIEDALGMPAFSHRMKKRDREIVELRYICTLILKNIFKSITYSNIGRLFGGHDHSSILHGLNKANDLLATNDIIFTTRYNIALKAVQQWLIQQ